MKRLWLRMLIALGTFIVGVGTFYVTWLNFRTPLDIPSLDSQLRIEIPKPITNAAANSKSVKEEWEELAAVESCTLGLSNYHPDLAASDHDEVERFEAGVFHSKRWVAFFDRDHNETVPFLISQIPKRRETKVHIAPFGNSLKGELAVYSLQFILKVNWYKLKKEYENRLDKTDNDQALLQRIIGTKRSANEMMNLWQSVFERSPHVDKS